MEQNRNFARLTYLAVVFVPLPWVLSFFSMNPDIVSLSKTFWIYFVVSIPLTAIALLIAKYFLHIRVFMGKAIEGGAHLIN